MCSCPPGISFACIHDIFPPPFHHQPPLLLFTIPETLSSDTLDGKPSSLVKRETRETMEVTEANVSALAEYLSQTLSPDAQVRLWGRGGSFEKDRKD